jgi:hypothetical protein
VLSLALWAASAHALTITVEVDGSGDYPDLDTALASLGDGDTLSIGAGMFSLGSYHSIAAEGIRIIGAGSDLTIVDGGGERPGRDLIFYGSVELAGIHFRNFDYPDARYVNAIAMEYWDTQQAVIERCRFSANAIGVGMLFANNFTGSLGTVPGPQVSIRDTEFFDNGVAIGVECCGEIEVENNLFFANERGLVMSQHSANPNLSVVSRHNSFV